MPPPGNKIKIKNLSLKGKQNSFTNQNIDSFTFSIHQSIKCSLLKTKDLETRWAETKNFLMCEYSQVFF